MIGGRNGAKALDSVELYDPSTGMFSPAGAMHTARSHVSGVLLNSGKVLVLGGYGASSSDVLDSAELYDPVSGIFTPTGSLQTRRAGSKLAVALLSGDVLVVGGVGSDGQSLSAAELYSSSSGSFSLTGVLSTARQHHSVTVLPNGLVLVVGGWTDLGDGALASAEVFHPDTGEFSLTEPLITGRGFHTAALLNNGTVLVAGGAAEALTSSTGLSSAEVFVCVSCLVPPEAPTQVMAQDVESDHGGTVLVTWTGSSTPNVKEYHVYSSANAGGPFSLLGTVSDPSATAYHGTGLVNGVFTHFVVRAFDGIQESENSNEAKAIPLNNFIPNAPKGLSIADVPHDEGTALSLSWIPSSSDNVVEQRVYRSLASGGPYALLASVPGNTTNTFVDANVTTPHTYYYVLSAWNGTEESLFTSETPGHPQDNRPVATSLQIDLAEDASALVTVIGQDPAGTAVTYAVVTPPASGQLSGTLPSVTYTPVKDFNGKDSFTYVVSNGFMTSETALVELTVSPRNDPPMAVADVAIIEEDARDVRLDVLVNDTTAPDSGESLTFTAVSPPNQGGMVKVGHDNQSLLYTPAQDFSGVETFTYTISDGTPNSEATATVTATVTPINDAPSATPFLLSWTPSSSPNIVAQRVYRGVHSGGPYQLVASMTDPTIASFTDTKGLEVGTTYYYVVIAYNEAWKSATSNEIFGVYGQRVVQGYEDNPVSFVVPGYDPEGDSLSYQIEQGPQQGSVMGEGPEFVYTPQANYVGSDSFTYTVSDGSLTSEIGTVIVTLAEVNDAPIAHPQTMPVTPNSENPISLTGDDGDPDAEQGLSFILDTLPQGGTVSLSVGGAELVPAQIPMRLNSPKLFYRSTNAEGGPDRFTFHVEDDGGTANGGNNRSSQASVTLNVVENQLPTVNVASAQHVILPNVATLDGMVSDDGLPHLPGSVTTNWSQQSGPGLVTFDNPIALHTTASFSVDGEYVLRLTANDGVATASADVTISVEPAIEFTAYNDLAWGGGQLSSNITTYTSPNGGSGLASSGLLVDYATGAETGVTLTVLGGEFNSESHATQGANLSAGDASAIFNGKISVQGAISYLNDMNDSLVLVFTGMDPSKRYEVAFVGHRDKYGWARASLVTIFGADTFTNISSTATDNPRTLPAGTIYSGPADPSTRLPADNLNGYIARFVEIDPGSDGEFRLIVSWDGDVGAEFKGKYGSAVMLKERAAPSQN